MALGSKSERAIEHAVLQREVELLRESLDEKKLEIIELKNQLKYTQDALIAKEAPEAYSDRKYAESLADQPELTEEQIEARRNQEQRSVIVSEYLRNMDKELFRDADDMIQLLTRGSAPLQETTSLHNNDES